MSTSEVERLLEENKRLKEQLEAIEAKSVLQQYKRLKEQLEVIEAKSVWQYFQDGRTLPRLHKTGTKTKSSENVKHGPISRIDKTQFGLIDIDDEQLSHTKLQHTSIFSTTTLGYSTEHDVQHHCMRVLEDILFATRLDKTLSLRSELAISDIKPDFWVISNERGFPVGVVEAKKPSKEAGRLESDINYGQLFDYMLRIRSFHGLKKVFGILTNFNEWQICWFPDTDDFAASSSTTLLAPLPVDIGETTQSLLIVPGRELHVSDMYTRENAKSLALALCSVMMKMRACALSGIAPVPLYSTDRLYIAMNEETWIWEPRIGSFNELSFEIPAKNTKKFFLLRDFHGGADGKVWLTCNTSGRMAVVKLFHKDRVTAMADEVSCWHKCGFASVFGTTLSKRPAVVMPFGFTFDSSKSIDNTWWCGEPGGRFPPIAGFEEAHKAAMELNPAVVLQECIHRCANALLVHEDIEWRHVAVFPTPSLKLLDYSFIDLSRMKPANSVKEALEKMMATVQAKGML